MIWIISISLQQKKNCWLSDFNKEYINATFDNPDRRLHKKIITRRNIRTTGKKKQYDHFKKDCQDRNNARNGDAFTVTKANKFLKNIDDVIDLIEENRSTNYNTVEDAIITIIDVKKRRKS